MFCCCLSSRNKREKVSDSPILPSSNLRHSADSLESESRSLISNYTIGAVIGSGTFATVKKVTDKETRKKYAVKIIDKSNLSQSSKQMIVSEINVLLKVRHEHALQLYEVFETDSEVQIVTQLAEGGELYEQISKKGSYTEHDAAIIVKQLVEVIAYLHNMGIVHRDIKPENLLCRDNAEIPYILVADFGLAKVMDDTNAVLMTTCGTPGYVAPEILKGGGYGKPVDMWSIGIVTFVLLGGYPPFWGDDVREIFDKILKGSYEFDPEYWDCVSDAAKTFIRNLLIMDPMRRLTAQDALKDKWLAQPEDILAVDILPNIRANFDAKATLRKAVTKINVLQAIKGRGGQLGSESI